MGKTVSELMPDLHRFRFGVMTIMEATGLFRDAWENGDLAACEHAVEVTKRALVEMRAAAARIAKGVQEHAGKEAADVGKRADGAAADGVRGRGRGRASTGGGSAMGGDGATERAGTGAGDGGGKS